MEEKISIVMQRAVRYCSERTAGWPDGDVIRVAALPEVRRALSAIDTAMLGGDVVACKDACRAWWRIVLAHTPVQKGG